MNAKIACLDFSLQKVKMKMGVQLLVSDVDQLDKMRYEYQHTYVKKWEPFPRFLFVIYVVTRRFLAEKVETSVRYHTDCNGCDFFHFC